MNASQIQEMPIDYGASIPLTVITISINMLSSLTNEIKDYSKTEDIFLTEGQIWELVHPNLWIFSVEMQFISGATTMML